MHQHLRALAAFILAPPLTVAICLSLSIAWLLVAEGSGGLLDAFPAIPLAFVSGSLVAWVFTIVLGLPAYILLKWLDIVSPWVTIAVAAAIGASFSLATGLWPANEGTSVSVNGCDVIVHGVRTACGYWYLAETMMFSGSIGAISGLIFWLVYAGGWKDPSRTH